MKNDPDSKCPAKITDLIRIANLLPQHVDAANIAQKITPLVHQSNSTLPASQQWFELFKGELMAYPAALEYIGNEHSPKEFFERYTEVVHIRATMEKLVENAMIFRMNLREKNMLVPLRPFNTDPAGMRIDYSKWGAGLGEFGASQGRIDGKITFELDEISKALQGRNIDRFRRCYICRKIFWARRSETEYCSRQCGNKLRVRKAEIKKLQKQIAAKDKKLEKQRVALKPDSPLVLQSVAEIKGLRMRLRAKRYKYRFLTNSESRLQFLHWLQYGSRSSFP